MKKCLAVLLVFVLAFAGLTVMVSATPSIEESFIGQIGNLTDGSSSVQIRVTKSATVDITPIQSKFNIIKGKNNAMKLAAVVDVSAIGDISLLDPNNLELEIPMAGVTPGTNVVILFEKKDGTVVELPGTVTEEGKVKFRITPESGITKDDFVKDPVTGKVAKAFVVLDDLDVVPEVNIGTPGQGVAGTTTGGTGSSGKGSKSEKTSDNVAPLFIVLALGAFVAGVSTKKLLAK